MKYDRPFLILFAALLGAVVPLQAESGLVFSNSSGTLTGDLAITDTLQIRGGNPGTNKVLYSKDGVGSAGWINPTSLGGDDLGNHVATATLQMGAYGVNTSSNITAARYQINGSTMVAILPGSNSIAYGVYAGSSNITGGNHNVFIGNNAGQSNTTGIRNTVTGHDALYNNTTGQDSTAIGYTALYSNTTGMGNNAYGSWALYSNTTGMRNTAAGVLSLANSVTGSDNAVFGYDAGYGASGQSFSSSTIMGAQAGYGLTTGSDNILYGYRAGYYITSGTGNIVIGYDKDTSAPTASNELNIGGVLYGDLAAKTIGISTRVPQAALDIVSTGTAANQYAQIWRDSDGVVRASMTADGKLYANITGAAGIPSGDNLGNHVATTTLNMASRAIINVTTIAATSTGLHISTGGTGSILSTDGLFINPGKGIYFTGKGNGVIVGNARGTGAVDLQTYRSAVTQVASGAYATVSGGNSNSAAADGATVSGGTSNMATGMDGTVSGGSGNSAGESAVVSGGNNNMASEQYSSVSGGMANTASGNSSAVLGGNVNTAKGDYSLAAGNLSSSTANGAFTWSDSEGTLVTNSSQDRTLFKNRGGFMITSTTGEPGVNIGMLQVVSSGSLNGDTNAQVWQDAAGVTLASIDDVGTMTALMFAGNGSWLTSLNASNVASGTLGDARLSSNVNLLNANQTVSGIKTYTSSVTASGNMKVGGVITIAGGSPAANRVLTATDGTGVASWVDPGTLVSGDNLGNHVATTTLNMAQFAVVNITTLAVPSDTAGLFISTGGTGSLLSTNGLYINPGKGIYFTGEGRNNVTHVIGNARGQGAVDLQTYRSLPTRVASGQASVIAGGSENSAIGTGSVVSGGDSNRAEGENATIGGGVYNWTFNDDATISGGSFNIARGLESVVPGGSNNVASGNYSFAAGYYSSSTANGSFTWADSKGVAVINSVADRTWFKNAGGFLVTGSTQPAGDGGFFVAGSGKVGIGLLQPVYALDVSTANTTDAYLARFGANGIIISTGGAIQTTGFGHGTHVANARGNGAVDLQTYRSAATQVASGEYAALSGGRMNIAYGFASTVAGGSENISSGTYSAVSGGRANTAIGYAALIAGGVGNYASSNGHTTISGGYNNTATGDYSVISGGRESMATGAYAALSGGYLNSAQGQRSFVAGGEQNTAKGSYSWAGGYYSSSTANGAFTWADSKGYEIQNASVNRTLFKNEGGFMVVGSTVNGSATLPANQGMLDIISTGTASSIYAQVWRNDGGTVVASMTSQGQLFTAIPSGDNLGSHTATQSLDMASRAIINVTTIAATSTGIHLSTGGTGSILSTNGLYINPGLGMYFTGPGNEAFAGNARGTGAVDLQTYRDSGAAQVACGEYSTISGGGNNTANNVYATVSGGFSNTAGNTYATVSGGKDNNAGGDGAAVSGGHYNVASGSNSVVGGGRYNTVIGTSAVAAGGEQNQASGKYSAVGGGNYGTASGTYATVAGGRGGQASDSYALVGGGYDNRASSEAAAAGGGYQNRASEYAATVAGGWLNSVTGLVGTIAGGYDNRVSNQYGFIGGGTTNRATGLTAVVGGGQTNTASGARAVIGGGIDNRASGSFSTVAGGENNKAQDTYTAVSGGYGNTAGGQYSMVSGGSLNTALGNNSWAGGFYSSSTANGAFTWADSKGYEIQNASVNRTLFKNEGGFMVVGSTVNGSATLPANQGMLDIISTGTASSIYAQVWRDADGVVRASMTADGKLYADISGATGLSGDNLGSHVATTTLQMGAYGVNTSSNITAARYQINGSTVIAVLPGTGSLGVGTNAGRINTGDANTLVGIDAGYTNTTGMNNTFLGYSAGNQSNNNGNSFIGAYAGYLNTSGDNNSFVGANAGYRNTTGAGNTYLGGSAGNLNVTGSANTLIGYMAGEGTFGNSFSSSTIVGYKAGVNLTTGVNNLLLGWQVGDALTTGWGNILIGYDLDTYGTGSNSQLNIGNLILGNMGAGSQYLHISTGGVGSVLSTDGFYINPGKQIYFTGVGNGVVAGGNRGTGAVDLQTYRTNANQAAEGQYSVLVGGLQNRAASNYSIVAGGNQNTASALYAAIFGGQSNTASGQNASILGGGNNAASANYAAVAGGMFNEANGAYSMVSGGQSNKASGSHSWAGGYVSSSTAVGAFTWAADSTFMDATVWNNVADRTVFKNRGGFMITSLQGLIADNLAMLDVVSTGTAANIYAQVWRNNSGTVVSSMTSQGALSLGGNSGIYGLTVSSNVSLAGTLYTAGGKVGIGATAPSYGLQVTRPDGVYFSTSATAYDGLYFSSDAMLVVGGKNVWDFNPRARLHIVSTGTSNSTYLIMSKFYTWGGTGSAAVKFYDYGDAGMMVMGYTGLSNSRILMNGGASDIGSAISLYNSAGAATTFLGSANSYFSGGLLGVGTNNPSLAVLEVKSTGTLATQYAQVWTDSTGLVVASMTANGKLTTLQAMPGDDLGSHTATQALKMNQFAIDNSSGISIVNDNAYFKMYPAASPTTGIEMITGAVDTNPSITLKNDGGASISISQNANGNEILSAQGISIANTTGGTGIKLDSAGRVGISTSAPVAGLASQSNSGIYLLGGSGDVNESGTINSTDNNILANWIIGSTVLDPGRYARADINGDGLVSYMDYEYLVDYNGSSEVPLGSRNQAKDIWSRNFSMDQNGWLAVGHWQPLGPLHVKSGSFEALFIKEDESEGPSIGIGTTTPAAKLDVVSTATASNVYAQVWRNGSREVVASMTSMGSLYAAVNAKVSTNSATAFYLTTGDAGKVITSTGSSTQTIYLPSVDASNIGMTFKVVKLGSGQVTIDAADSDTINDSGVGDTVYNNATSPAYASIELILVTDTQWAITGGYGSWITTD